MTTRRAAAASIALAAACGGGGSPAGDDDADAAADAAVFRCNPDPNEPNDSTAQSTPTEVGAAVTEQAFGGVAICPDGEHDLYRVILEGAGPHTLRATVTYDALGDPPGASDLQVALLPGGVQGAPAGEHTVEITAGGLGAGTYHVDVFGTTFVANNYDVVIRCEAGC